MDQQKIGKFIQQSRKDLGLTQKELADRLGISDKTISKWETGKGMPDLSLFKPLCDELNISLNEFLSGEKIESKQYSNRLEENIASAIDYSNEKVSQKDKILSQIMIVYGLILTFISYKLIFVLLGIIITLYGCNKLLKKIEKKRRHLFITIYSLFLLVALFVSDYINVSSYNKPPRLSIIRLVDERQIEYQTLFYNAYLCNYETSNEYYEVNFMKDDNVCLNSFSPDKSDITNIIQYQNKYLGDNSNTINLYNSLPLNEYEHNFEIDSDNLGLIVNYKNSTTYLNEDNDDEIFIKRNLFYNSLSLFVLIDNLEYIKFNFLDNSYLITKTNLANKYTNYQQIIVGDDIKEDLFRKHVLEYAKNDQNINKVFNDIFIQKKATD